MTTDTSKAPEQKYSKPKDVYGADLSNVPDMLETIWLTRVEDEDFEYSWCHHRVDDEDIPYVRRDLFDAVQARAEKAEAVVEKSITREFAEVRFRAIRAENERLRARIVAGLAACDQFDGPVSNSAFVNGQSTCAQQIRAALERKEGET